MPKLGCNMPDMGIYDDLLRRTDGVQDAPARAGATSLADALFTTTQQRVLRCLYGQPERAFFANELIKLTGSGSGAVQRELARLHSSGLVSSRRLGRQRMFQANSNAPIYDELRRIVIKTIGAADPIRNALSSLRDRISTAFIYGSVAKGTDHADSDIDLMIVADKVALEDVFRALEPAERILGRKISPTVMGTAEFDKKRRARDGFLHKVLEGTIVGITGDAPTSAS